MPANHSLNSEQQVEILLVENHELAASDEYAHGRRELLARLPACRIWQSSPGAIASGLAGSGPAGAPWPSPAALLKVSRATRWLVVCQAALIVSDNLHGELMATLDGGAGCALPDDRRSQSAPSPDYATRLSMEQYVARLAARDRTGLFDGRAPLLFMVERTALEGAVSEHSALDWLDVPLRCNTRIAQHAWIHDWSGYQQNDRSEMLALLPADVDSLLDVGGGAGGFVQAFLAARGGVAHLLEPSDAADLAQAKGITVFRQMLGGDAVLPRRYKAVSLLDVLEHMSDPMAALLAARQLLLPGGYVLLSVPNVGFWRVVADLIGGRFDYLPVGIQCVTHLRFFTAHSLRDLLGQAGFTVVDWRNAESAVPTQWQSVFAGVDQAGQPVDQVNLAVESFHVLARRN